MKPIRFKILLYSILAVSVFCSNAFSAQIVVQECDILIVGGSLGGVSGALQASRMAGQYGIKKIILTEETDWLGGQYTTQGVTASDDNWHIINGEYETAASKGFYELHETIRNFYRKAALETARQRVENGEANSAARRMDLARIESKKFSPGNPWSLRMSFLPEDCVKAINILLKPYTTSGVLEVKYLLKPTRVLKDGNRVTGVELTNVRDGKHLVINAKITLDATELGDLLPLSGSEYRVGIEASSDTNEPSLFDAGGKALFPKSLCECTQAFTYPFAIEWADPNEDHRMGWESRPKSYDKYRYRFLLRSYLFAKENEIGNKNGTWPGNSFWSYRRMLDAMNVNPKLRPDLYPHWRKGEWITKFDPQSTPEFFIPSVYHANVGDVAEINWESNDYAGETIIDVPQEKREEILERAKEQSLAFLFWLWYEVPRDPVDSRADPKIESNWSTDPVTGKRRGYANLKLRGDVMGTKDGLSKMPYIRESRRVKAVRTIVQQDIMGNAESRSRLFHDSVGVGHYAMDLHPCDMGEAKKISVQFKPNESAAALFQIPWSAMVPEKTDGLIPACKNIGTTHITNGAYRIHPVEFEIGQAAGVCAVLCAAGKYEPRDMVSLATPSMVPTENEKRLRQLQYELLKSGVPIFWNLDCGWDSSYFEAVQFSSLLGIIEPHGLKFEPDKPLSVEEAVIAAAKLFGGIGYDSNQPANEREFKSLLKKLAENNYCQKKLSRGEAAKKVFGILSKRYGLK